MEGQPLVPFHTSAFKEGTKGAGGLCSANGCRGEATTMFRSVVAPVGRQEHVRWTACCVAHGRGWAEGQEARAAARLRDEERRVRREAEEARAYAELRARPPRQRLQNLLRASTPICGPAMTLASANVAYGTTNRSNGLVHQPDRVGIVWTQDPPAIGVRWLCGAMSLEAVLLASVPADRRTCAKCDALSVGIKGPSVYYAEREGLIKIGFSTDPGTRVRGLKATMLASEPGTRKLEAERHAQFQHLRVVGEWFKPSDELMAFVSSLREAAA